MLCTKCGKNEATVYFSKTVNGNKTELHLCAECAKHSGIAENFNRHRQYMRMLSPLGFPGVSETFTGLADTFFDHKPEKQAEVCPGCGKTAEEITKSGKAGCPMCCEVFPGSILKKKPAESKPDKLTQLRAELDKAIKAERYEDAARFRDEIKALEQTNL